jgi:hypothetical protein
LLGGPHCAMHFLLLSLVERSDLLLKVIRIQEFCGSILRCGSSESAKLYSGFEHPYRNTSSFFFELEFPWYKRVSVVSY